MIIDFHTHTFPDAICERTIEKLSHLSGSKAFTNGSVAGLITSMKKANVDYSINLPVMTSPAQVEKVNHSLVMQKDTLLADGIITFGGMHPDYDNYKQELLFLKESGIKGIKLHPAYQNVDIDDIRMLHIIEACENLGLIVLVHAGIDIGIYDHNYASVPQILHVLQEVSPSKLVLAHFGNWACWDAVEKDLAGAPVYLDTAFALGEITPAPFPDASPIRTQNLSNEDFVRIAGKHGMERVLFATDSPWEDQADYIKRIEAMPLTPTQKKQILGENAANLLQI